MKKAKKTKKTKRTLRKKVCCRRKPAKKGKKIKRISTGMLQYFLDKIAAI